ncbi:hypothetical protein V8E55_010259, partial [Tylopilus felleus]
RTPHTPCSEYSPCLCRSCMGRGTKRSGDYWRSYSRVRETQVSLHGRGDLGASIVTVVSRPILLCSTSYHPHTSHP